jgi:cytochrome c1
MNAYWIGFLLLSALYGGSALAQTSRGELLYQTYCNACHSEQIYWRDKNIATDRPGLVREVGRWQANSNLDWSADDIEAVVRYLDDHHYHYPKPEK